MYVVTVDIDKCEACGDCVDTCPYESFVLVVTDGKEHAEYVENEECIGCESCVAVCPTQSISMKDINDTPHINFPKPLLAARAHPRPPIVPRPAPPDARHQLTLGRRRRSH